MTLEDLFVSHKLVDPVEFDFVKPSLPQPIYLNLDRVLKIANPVEDNSSVTEDTQENNSDRSTWKVNTIKTKLEPLQQPLQQVVLPLQLSLQLSVLPLQQPLLQPLLQAVLVLQQAQRRSLHKNDNISIAMNYFLNKGLTTEQASGIIGNLIAESNLDPAAINKAEKKKGYKGYGRGIALWSNARVDLFRNVMGKDVENASLTEQLDFVWYELNRRKTLLDKLRNSKTVQESADLILRGYENGSESALVTPEQMLKTYSRAYAKLNLGPYDFYKMLNKRVQYSNNALKHYSK